MLSSALMQTVEECRDRAVELLVSGPAAAPAAALRIAGARGHRDILEVDMGGTSFDMCVIRDGRIPTTREAWVGQERVATKMVEVGAIGAGGGSIAWIDSLGLLRVGPQSAGADPGPAAYGRADEPTVTDADLVLGYLPADYFLGGEVTLHPDRAIAAIDSVGGPLGPWHRRGGRSDLRHRQRRDGRRGHRGRARSRAWTSAASCWSPAVARAGSTARRSPGALASPRCTARWRRRCSARWGC